MPRWSAETRHRADIFDELPPWWDQATASKGLFLLDSRILRIWEDGFDDPDSALRVLILRRDGEIVAGLPLYAVGGRLRSMGRTHFPWMDVISKDDPEVIDRIPAWLDSVRVAHLYRVPAESLMVDEVAGRPRWHIQRTIESPYVDLRDGMEKVRSQWTSNFRKKLGRRARRLAEIGDVAFVDHPANDEVGRTLEAGLDLEERGWKGESGVAVRCKPSLERWLRSITEVASHMGWLRLSTLSVDDRLLAFSYDLEYGGSRYGILSAYAEDDDVRTFSAGNLLLEAILARAASTGVETYELGHGTQSWKNDWTPDVRLLQDLLIFGSGISGRALALGERIVRGHRR